MSKIAGTGLIQIEPIYLAQVKTILNTHLPKDAVVWVFGSRATGKPKPYSDLDLAIDANGKQLDFETCAALSSEFEESDLPYKVDIVDLATVSPEFRAIIEKTSVSLELRN